MYPYNSMYNKSASRIALTEVNACAFILACNFDGGCKREFAIRLSQYDTDHLELSYMEVVVYHCRVFTARRSAGSAETL